MAAVPWTWPKHNAAGCHVSLWQASQVACWYAPGPAMAHAHRIQVKICLTPAQSGTTNQAFGLFLYCGDGLGPVLSRKHLEEAAGQDEQRVARTRHRWSNPGVQVAGHYLGCRSLGRVIWRPVERRQLWQEAEATRRLRGGLSTLAHCSTVKSVVQPHAPHVRPANQRASRGKQTGQRVAEPCSEESTRKVPFENGVQRWVRSGKQAMAARDRKTKTEEWVARLVGLQLEEKDEQAELAVGSALMGKHHSLWGLVLDKLGGSTNWKLAIQVLKQLQSQPWYTPHPRWQTKVILILGKAGRPTEAEELFRTMDCRPNAQAYNALMKAYVEAGLEDKVEALLQEMEGTATCQPDERTYHVLLEARAMAGDAAGAERLFEEVLSKVPAPDLLIYSAMIRVYARCSSWDKAEAMAVGMVASGLLPNLWLWNLLIDGFATAGHPEKFWNVFLAARSAGLVLSRESCTSLICQLAKAGNLASAERLFLAMEEQGCEPDLVAHNALVAAFAHAGMTSKMKAVVSKMRSLGLAPDLVTYTACLKGYLKAGQVERALETVHQMERRGFQPDWHVYGTALAAADGQGMVRAVEKLVDEVAAGDGPVSEAVYGATREATRRATGQQEKSETSDAGLALDRSRLSAETIEAALAGECSGNQWPAMSDALAKLTAAGLEPSVTVYNLLLISFLDGQKMDRALALLSLMRAQGHAPNRTTYNMLISRLGRGGHLEACEWLMERMQASGCQADVYTYNSMLAAYSTAGLLPKMEALLASMTQGGCQPDLVSFNTLISAYSRMDRWQGVAKMEHAYQMCRQAGLMPDKYTVEGLERGLAIARKKASKWRYNAKRRARLEAEKGDEAGAADVASEDIL